MNPQPRALYLLNFVSMWECFSYYGMRVLLVLFMTHELRFSDQQAFVLYALYTTLVEFGGVAGGVIADRFLGLRSSIAIGGWTIAFGHICMAMPESQPFFFLGLGMIIVGTSLFRSNVAAFLGEFYEVKDPRLDAGYTIYYTGVNIGGFFAAILCGFVGEVYGWHYGFSLAALGMLAGNIALMMGKKLLTPPKQQRTPTAAARIYSMLGMGVVGPLCALALYYADVVILWFPLAAAGCIFYALRQVKGCTTSEKRGLKTLALYIVFLILFYGCEEQLGSTLVLFAERHIDRDTLFGTFPAASMVTFNPLTILVAGPLLSRFLVRMRLSAMSKIQWSFVLLGLSFCVLYAGSFTASGEGMVGLSYGIISIILIALGEILIGPTVFAAAAKYAPAALQGLTMGMVTLGFSLANLFSGMLSQMMTVTEEANSLEVYAGGFSTVGFAALFVALLLLFTQRNRKEAIIC